MPSLHHFPDRHVTVDRRDGQYLSFPDVALARDGRLLCAYQQSDQHVARRRALLLAESRDQGATWTRPRVLNASAGHCPRFTVLEDGEILLMEDHANSLYHSLDHGAAFAAHPASGIAHSMQDRILPLGGDRFFTTGHNHRGTHPQPYTRQAPSEQMGYVSDNRGISWTPLSVLASERNLVLCEASAARLPDGRILALLRENSGVFEPMYRVESSDEGRTWSDPAPTPLIGHRPTLGLTRDGRLLVTYRNVGPDGGAAAWMGGLEDLDDFRVHGLARNPGNPRLTGQGLVIATRQGFPTRQRPDADAAIYVLRPITDPERATADLTVRVKTEGGGENAAAAHLGLWWRILPDRLVPARDDRPDIPLAPGFHDLRFRYKGGAVTVYVDNERRARIPVEPSAAARRILFGNAPGEGGHAGRSVWRSASLTVDEPRQGRKYAWAWDHTRGLPDAWARGHVLELANGRQANPGDYGYSGWTELPDGRFFCAYHHADGAEPGYAEGRSAHIRGTWFTADDFSA
ncbi:MAG: sialidase family protein [Thermodesulfobacteriota bacterium]